jgi:hypothetical protein
MGKAGEGIGILGRRITDDPAIDKLRRPLQRIRPERAGTCRLYVCHEDFACIALSSTVLDIGGKAAGRTDVAARQVQGISRSRRS